MPFYPAKTGKQLITAALLLTLIVGISASGLNSAPARADAGPDLVIQNITMSPSEPAIDDPVTITVAVKNQGTAVAALSNVVGYMDSTILATLAVSQLEAGASATVTFTWKAEPGSHTIKAVADATELVTETNETNNSKTYTFTTLAVDLIVQSITWTPTTPSRGDSVTFSVAVKNQGTAASRGTILDLYIDGNSRGIQEVPGINPGGTVTRTYTWPALTGQHAVKAVVDEGNTVREGNENNNEKTVTFATAAPDLVIEKITWSPLNPSRNDTLSVNATVKNQGIGRSDACNLAYYVEGEMKASVPVAALDAGASVNTTYSMVIKADKLTIKGVVDYLQTVTESDETNNEKTVTLNTLAPDLTVAGITWSPLNAAVGDSVSINVTVANYGGGRSEVTRAAIYIDGASYFTPDIPPINAGATAVLPFTWTATGGTHAIGVAIDFNNTLAETNEDNNKTTVNIPIAPADLIIPTIAWTPENFAIGDTVTFQVSVKNQGAGRADPFSVAAFMDGIMIGTETISRIEPGASANRTFNWVALNGRHTFKAVADYNKYLTEEDEANNEHSVTVAPDMPDLLVDTITWSPADIRAGSEITFDIAIKNLGTLKAGPTRVAYYVDKAVAGYTDIGLLEAGAVAEVQFLWSATAGSHDINIVADSSNKVSEIDEANNAKTVNIPPPDLIVNGITWAPAGAATGDNVKLTATIKNQGSGVSQATQATCYVDGEAIATADLPGIEAGGSVTQTFSWTAAAGGHKIKVAADVDNRVTESDETNNDKEVTFGTLTPDLVVQNIGWLMPNPMTDNKVIFTISVKNQGTGDAPSSNLTYTIDKRAAVTVKVAAIPAGGTAAVTFTTELELAPHTITARIDPAGKISELDETNNTASLSFTTVVPDLTVLTITLTPAPALPGDDVTISVRMENRGRQKAPAAKLSLSVDNVTLVSADIKALDVGELISQDFHWKAVAGNHEIEVTADPGNLIAESDETNNYKARAITIDKPAAAAPAPKTTKLASAAPAKKGFMASYWWLLLLVTAGLGGAAFFTTLKSIRKQ